jgi:hypothetical protein
MTIRRWLVLGVLVAGLTIALRAQEPDQPPAAHLVVADASDLVRVYSWWCWTERPWLPPRCVPMEAILTVFLREGEVWEGVLPRAAAPPLEVRR